MTDDLAHMHLQQQQQHTTLVSCSLLRALESLLPIPAAHALPPLYDASEADAILLRGKCGCCLLLIAFLWVWNPLSVMHITHSVCYPAIDHLCALNATANFIDGQDTSALPIAIPESTSSATADALSTSAPTSSSLPWSSWNQLLSPTDRPTVFDFSSLSGIQQQQQQQRSPVFNTLHLAQAMQLQQQSTPTLHATSPTFDAADFSSSSTPRRNSTATTQLSLQQQLLLLQQQQQQQQIQQRRSGVAARMRIHLPRRHSYHHGVSSPLTSPYHPPQQQQQQQHQHTYPPTPTYNNTPTFGFPLQPQTASPNLSQQQATPAAGGGMVATSLRPMEWHLVTPVDTASKATVVSNRVRLTGVRPPTSPTPAPAPAAPATGLAIASSPSTSPPNMHSTQAALPAVSVSPPSHSVS
ncbi:hypothetical protein RI367_002624 [Sorochytrium milnesiophthora]